MRSTKKCFLEVAKVLSVCNYFPFGLCYASISAGSRDGSLTPPFPERADSFHKDGAGTTSASWLLWLWGWSMGVWKVE